MYWWIENLVLASEADREYLRTQIGQNGVLSLPGWRILINSGTLEEDASITKDLAEDWFVDKRQPTCEQLKILIESYMLGSWSPDPGSGSAPNVALIDAHINGVDYVGNVYTKEQTEDMIADGFNSNAITVSTDPPSGVPADGQQWIQYIPN